MLPAADDVMQILDIETGFTAGTDLFVGIEPDSPNNVIVIYDTGGGAPDLPGFRQPTVQIRSRNTNYLDGWANINKAVQALLNVSARNVGQDNTYHSAWWLQSDIMFLERDANDRAVFTANMRGHRSD